MHGPPHPAFLMVCVVWIAEGNVRQTGVELVSWELCVATKELSPNDELFLHETVWQGEGGMHPRSSDSR